MTLPTRCVTSKRHMLTPTPPPTCFAWGASPCPLPLNVGSLEFKAHPSKAGSPPGLPGVAPRVGTRREGDIKKGDTGHTGHVDPCWELAPAPLGRRKTHKPRGSPRSPLGDEEKRGRERGRGARSAAPLPHTPPTLNAPFAPRPIHPIRRGAAPFAVRPRPLAARRGHGAAGAGAGRRDGGKQNQLIG